MLLSSGAIFTVKKPPVKILVHRSLLRARLYLISPTPRIFRGHNFRKMRNRAGIIERFLTGTYEVEYSNVTKTKKQEGCGLGLGRAPVAGYSSILPVRHQG